MTGINFDTYQSPFSWRYASDEMRNIFSETNKRKTWRKVWVALARAQNKAGLITNKEFKDIEKNSKKIDIKQSLEIEKEIYHDIMSEIKAFAQNAKIGGGKIHLGATSTDIDDNAQILINLQALTLIEKKLITLLLNFSTIIKKHQKTICMGYTHIQPAEPVTIGFRFSIYAQDLLNDLISIREVRKNIKTKGIKGAVGSGASYERLLKKEKYNSQWINSEVMKELYLTDVTISGQTYPRKTDFILISALTSIAQSLHKFCFDLRIMQSPNFGEWQEARSSKRVGSSSMPFKKNPDKAEKVCSLARLISAFPQIAWNNAANSLLERTLDDSASRRIFIPESYLACDEIIDTTNDLVSNLEINEKNIDNNLRKFAPFSGTESLMMEVVKNGGDRQEIHEVIRKISMQAWKQINSGKTNPLINLLKKDKIVTKFVKIENIEKLLAPENHIGLAQYRCKKILLEIKKELK